MSYARPKTRESAGPSPVPHPAAMAEGWGEGRQDPGASYFRRRGRGGGPKMTSLLTIWFGPGKSSDSET